MSDTQLPPVDDLELPQVDDLTLPADDLALDEGLSLADVSESGPAAPAAVPVLAKPVKAMSPDQVIGLVAKLTGMTLPAEVRADYAKALTEDQLVQLGVMASGMCEALAEYGISADGAGGSLPAWASLLVGAGVLGFGVYTHRGTYAAKAQQLNNPAAPGAGPGDFDFSSGLGSIEAGNFAAAVGVGGDE